MSEKMYPIPFRSLMNWITRRARREDWRGLRRAHSAGSPTRPRSLPIFGEKIETPVRPRCRPATASWRRISSPPTSQARASSRSRPFRRWTARSLPPVCRVPASLQTTRATTSEWSTELEVGQALDEYVKAWCALKIMAKVYGTAATRTALCSTCPSAMTSRESVARRSTHYIESA